MSSLSVHCDNKQTDMTIEVKGQQFEVTIQRGYGLTCASCQVNGERISTGDLHGDTAAMTGIRNLIEGAMARQVEPLDLDTMFQINCID